MGPTDVLDVPEEFVCPISRQVMQEPVTIESGKTFDRESIEEWFSCGKLTCPLTRQPVNPTVITRDEKLSHDIKEWLRKQDDSFAFVELSTSPIEVLRGHFLLPAQQCCSKPTLDSLVRQLRTSRTSVGRIHILQQLLAFTTLSQQNRLEITAAGVVPTLLNIILTQAGPVRWYAVEIVSFLSLNISTVPAILEALYLTVPWISSQVQKHGRRRTVLALARFLTSIQPETATTAAWSLWIMSVQAKVRKQLARNRVVKPLAALLKHSNENVCIAAAHCVRSLVTAQGGIRLLKKWNSLEPLRDMMRSSNMEVQLAACGAMSNVAFALESKLKKIRRLLSGVEILPQIRMMLETNDSCAQRAAANLLRSLVLDPDILPEVLSSGCFAALLHVLTQDAEVCVNCAIATLRSMTSHSSDALKHTICSSGAIPVLTHLLAIGKQNLQACAAKTLGDLVASSTASYFRHPPIFSAILGLLHSTSDRLQYHAASILLNVFIATDRNFDSLAVEDFAALRSLIKLLSSTNVQYQYVAAALLKHIALVDVNRMYIVQVGGIHALVELLKHHGGKGIVGMECAEALLLMSLAGPYFRAEISNACKDGTAVPEILSGLMAAV